MKRLFAMLLCAVLAISCFTACGNEYGIKLKEGEKYKFYLESCTMDYKSSDEKYMDYTKTKFDKNGNPVEIVYGSKKDKKNQDSRKYVLTYDDNNCPKTCVETYIYDDGDKDVYNYSFKFDEKKRMVELLRKDSLRTEYTYDDQDRVLSVLRYELFENDVQNLANEEKYTYTEKGYISEETNYLRNSNSKTEYQFFTDEKGEIIEKVLSSRYYNDMANEMDFDGEDHIYSASGEEEAEKKYEHGQLVSEYFTVGHSTTSYSYSGGEKEPEHVTEILANGTERTRYYSGGKLTGYTDATYDKNETKKIQYDSNGDASYETTYYEEYNEAGVLVRGERVTESKNGPYVKSSVGIYDDKGRLIKATYEEEGELVYEDVYEYKNDKLVKESHTPHISSDGDEKIITYSFDNNGNSLGYVTKINGRKNEEEKLDSYGNRLYSFVELEENGHMEEKASFRAYVDDGRPDVFVIINKLY